jgi:hypothetical protein
MSLVLRLFLIFVGVLALFWLLAIVVGWLWYVVVIVGVVAVIGVVIWLLTHNGKDSNAPKPVTRKHAHKAEKELKSLEKRQKNGPQ